MPEPKNELTDPNYVPQKITINDSIGTGQVLNFPIPDKSKDISEDNLIRLENKIDELNRKLDLIFGDHVLIDGRFVKIK